VQLRTSQSSEMLNKNCKVRAERICNMLKTFWEIYVFETWPSKPRRVFFRTEYVELATCLLLIYILFIICYETYIFSLELCCYYVKCKAAFFSPTHYIFFRFFKIYRDAYVTMAK
jgi:hypothetical protein